MLGYRLRDSLQLKLLKYCMIYAWSMPDSENGSHVRLGILNHSLHSILNEVPALDILRLLSKAVN